MYLFEKIFQRNDRFFLQIYYIILGLLLNIGSLGANYLRNQDWRLPDSYIEGSILITLIFWSLSIAISKEDRFIKGTAQWFRVEFVFLIETFLIAILLTVIFKVTANYSRIWLFANFGISVVVFLVLKVIFDFIYSYLIKSNSIQRNILLIGDAKSCQSIIKKFPKKISNSVIKCLIAIDQIDNKDLNFYGVPISVNNSL